MQIFNIFITSNVMSSKLSSSFYRYETAELMIKFDTHN